MIPIIGIVDYDFISNSGRGLGIPSLWAMKTAAYVKKEKKQSPLFISKIEQIENCEEVYFFSNKILEEIPQEVFFFNNIKCYGDFLPDELPSLIHHMPPDTDIYKMFIQEKLANKKTSVNKALTFLESTYLQIKLQDNFLPLPPIFPGKRVYIYDKDILSYENCWEILDKVIAKKPSTIFMVQPIQCHSLKQFFYLREEYEKVSRQNKIFLDFYIPANDLGYYFGKYKMKLLGEISKNSNVYVYLGKNYGTAAYGQVFYIRNLMYCLNLIFSYYSRNIPILTEIYYPKMEDNPYLSIYKVICSWANSKDYDKKIPDFLHGKENKENFETFLNKHSIFKPFMIYSKNELIYTKGIWRVI